MKLTVMVLALGALSLNEQALAYTEETTILRQEFEFEVRDSQIGEIGEVDASKFDVVPFVWGLSISKDQKVRAFFYEYFTGEIAPPDRYWLDQVEVAGLHAGVTPEGRKQIYAVDSSGEPVVCAVEKGFKGRHFGNPSWNFSPNCKVQLIGLGIRKEGYLGRAIRPWKTKLKYRSFSDLKLVVTVGRPNP